RWIRAADPAADGGSSLGCSGPKLFRRTRRASQRAYAVTSGPARNFSGGALWPATGPLGRARRGARPPPAVERREPRTSMRARSASPSSRPVRIAARAREPLLVLPVAERLEVQRAIDRLELGERAGRAEVALPLDR